jgi:putative spermidine/putrescine transport system substrate-binding protein
MNVSDQSPRRRPLGALITRREMLQYSAIAGAGALLAACQPTPAAQPTPTISPEQLLAGTESIPLDVLAAQAQKEGALTTMALPHNWANYGEILEAFKKKYNLAITELKPDAGSGDEIDALKKKRDDKSAEAPDTVDIGVVYAVSGKTDALFAPYKVATWATIPDSFKDSDGFWSVDYYGVLVFEVNLAVVTDVLQDWADLLKPQYKDKKLVALAGDPTKSNQAIYSVWAAGLSRTSSPDDAPMAGLQFFAELNKMGNLVLDQAKLETVASGATPIVVRWDYLALGDRDKLAGAPALDVVIPRSGVLGSPYAMAISAFADHPFAARLWKEFLYSDEGQLLWLKGYAHPARYADLVKNNKVPSDLAARLPPAELYTKAFFPTVDQIAKAKQVITENWVKVVLGG